MEAQRYPGDFDGLVVGNPAHDWTRFYAGAHLWYALATLDDPESWIPPAKAVLLGEAVTAACDAIDGIEDGVLDDPRACDFDPAAISDGARMATRVQHDLADCPGRGRISRIIPANRGESAGRRREWWSVITCAVSGPRRTPVPRETGVR